MIDAAEQVRINAALEKADGDRNLASVILGISPPELNKKIGRCPDLKILWKENRGVTSAPPTDAQTLHREPAPMPPPMDLTQEETDLLDSTIKEDEMLRDGLEKLNLTTDEAGIAVGLQGFHQKYFIKSINILGASNTVVCLKLQSRMAEIELRIKEVQLKIAENPALITSEHGIVYNPREALVREEKYLYDTYVALGDLVRKMFEISNKAALLQAMVRYRMNPNNNNNGHQQKPGFQPARILNANGNGNDRPASQ